MVVLPLLDPAAHARLSTDATLADAHATAQVAQWAFGAKPHPLSRALERAAARARRSQKRTDAKREGTAGKSSDDGTADGDERGGGGGSLVKRLKPLLRARSLPCVAEVVQLLSDVHTAAARTARREARGRPAQRGRRVRASSLGDFRTQVLQLLSDVREAAKRAARREAAAEKARVAAEKERAAEHEKQRLARLEMANLTRAGAPYSLTSRDIA